MFPCEPSWVCESLRGVACSQEGAFRESSRLLSLYVLGWRAEFAQCWMADLIILPEFYCKLCFSLSLSFLPFPLSCYFPGGFKSFFFFFFNLSVVASSSPRSVCFLFSEALPLGFVTLSIVYGQRGTTPYIYGLCVCINKKARIYC